ncbi:unnamed protein product, partial [marine sediment metagenome]
MLLLGFKSGNIQILDVKIGKYLRLGSDYDHTDEVTCADFNDHLCLFATGSLDCKVKLWDYKKDLVRELAMTQPVRALQFLDISGNIIVGEGTDISLVAPKTYLTRSYATIVADKLRRHATSLLDRLRREIGAPEGETKKRGTRIPRPSLKLAERLRVMTK